MGVKSFWDNFLDFFGLNEELVETEDENHLHSSQKIVSIHRTKGLKVSVYHPVSIDDVKIIVDDLKNRKPVVINLEDVDLETARRIVDFISGAIYGLDGNIKKVGEAVFLITPNNISIDGDSIEDNSERSFLLS
ncbi:cell division protein SepF [Halothermothrix orenii]|uniref:Cell division protein SepF n=1 Tax=Halothermothrix orenii (strain H 168 / OCM 544 / DSM 9562) TaxID=373903 RepID=B8CWL0_HALOH|nr:cell division protein SepF [Halothermothrix orenii]ACL69679.1 uncharacterized protein conserved in bacteria [Halothermothrix orenii H 168]